MKLYYSPGACSQAVHITLHEAGLAFEPVLSPTKTHQLPDGTSFYSINPLGYVPVLELDDGTRLREVPVVLQYVADQVPTRNLAPAAGTLPRYRLQEWLNFIATELHKSIGGLFNPALPEEARQIFRDRGLQRLKWVDEQLAGKPFVMGDTFSVADPYLFVVSGWTRPLKMDISGLANLLAFRERMAARPSVRTALKAEGLLK